MSKTLLSILPRDVKVELKRFMAYNRFASPKGIKAHRRTVEVVSEILKKADHPSLYHYAQLVNLHEAVLTDTSLLARLIKH
jgi:hypothetical protein